MEESSFKKSIIKSTVWVMIFTFAAKVLGFFKSMIQASYFGASELTDAFNIAQGFSSNILILISTAISVAFVPMYMKNKMDQDRDEKAFASSTLMFFSFFSIVLSIVLYFFADALMRLAAPSYSGEQLVQTVRFFRLSLVGLLFSVGTSIYQQLLNAERVYGFSAVSSLVNSFAIVGCIVLLTQKIGIWSLVIAYIVSYILQNIVVAIRGHKYGKYTFKYGVWNYEIKDLLMLSAPIFISQGTVEINQIVDKALLAKQSAGAITIVSYAIVLYEFFTTLLKTSLSTVLYTEFAQLAAKNEKQKIVHLLKENLYIIVLICLPITIVAGVDSKDIVEIIYGHGNYDMSAVIMTSKVFSIYILCLTAAVVKAILIKVYYCFSDTKTPMKLSVCEVITNITLSIIFSYIWGMMGVVMGTVAAEILWLIGMLIDFNRHYVRIFNLKYFFHYWKIIVSNITLLISVLGLNQYIQCTAIIKFLILAFFSLVIYLIMLFVFWKNEMMHLLDSIIRYLKIKFAKD